MNVDILKNQLSDAARMIFADMAFLDVLDVPEGTQVPEISGPWASIELKGTTEGLLVLQLPLDLKITLIESIYVLPWDELAVDQKDDGLLEVLNVLAGHYVSTQEESDGFLKLSIPGVVFDKDDLPVRDPDADISLDAEGTFFRMLFYSSESSK